MSSVKDLEYFLEDIDKPNQEGVVIKVTSRTGDVEFLEVPKKYEKVPDKFVKKANQVYGTVDFKLLPVYKFPKSLEGMVDTGIDELAQQNERSTDKVILVITDKSNKKKFGIRTVPEEYKKNIKHL